MLFSLAFRTSFRFACLHFCIAFIANFWLGPSFGGVTTSSRIGPVLHVPLTSGRSEPRNGKGEHQFDMELNMISKMKVGQLWPTDIQRILVILKWFFWIIKILWLWATTQLVKQKLRTTALSDLRCSCQCNWECVPICANFSYQFRIYCDVMCHNSVAEPKIPNSHRVRCLDALRSQMQIWIQAAS